jgi:hypothetical protein
VAKTDERVMKMVEQALARNPDAPGDELYERAKKMNGGIARMSRRQFHARYPLQVKRRLGGRRRRKAGGKQVVAVAARGGRGNGNREAVRQVFLRFAQDVASASETPGGLVKVILSVDRYVDEALKSGGR